IPGATPEEAARLTDAGLDGVFSSLPWWNGRDAWLAEEYGRLRRVAPVMCAPEAPFASRIAHDEPDPLVRRRHACQVLRVAAAIGDGLLVP
ncbi:hypothetical protein ABTM67_19430, partial [Acinetobacter baumannii]